MVTCNNTSVTLQIRTRMGCISGKTSTVSPIAVVEGVTDEGQTRLIDCSQPNQIPPEVKPSTPVERTVQQSVATSAPVSARIPSVKAIKAGYDRLSDAQSRRTEELTNEPAQQTSTPRFTSRSASLLPEWRKLALEVRPETTPASFKTNDSHHIAPRFSPDLSDFEDSVSSTTMERAMLRQEAVERLMSSKFIYDGNRMSIESESSFNILESFSSNSSIADATSEEFFTSSPQNNRNPNPSNGSRISSEIVASASTGKRVQERFTVQSIPLVSKHKSDDD